MMDRIKHTRAGDIRRLANSVMAHIWRKGPLGKAGAVLAAPFIYLDLCLSCALLVAVKAVAK